MTTLRVIFTDEEWQGYKSHFYVPKQHHRPMIPPSFPVLVASAITTENPLYNPTHYADHSFIEIADLKRALGIS